MKNPAAVALGRLGGQAGTGKAKARTSEQARAAVAARWAKVKRKPKNKAENQELTNIRSYIKRHDYQNQSQAA